MNSVDKINSYIYFSFDGDEFDLNEVTKSLQLKPTLAKSKSRPTPKHTYWQYSVHAGESLDLEKVLLEIINIFEPKIETIIELKNKWSLSTRLQFVIEIDCAEDKSTPFFPLNSRVINFLSKTGTDVDFDIYKI